MFHVKHLSQCSAISEQMFHVKQSTERTVFENARETPSCKHGKPCVTVAIRGAFQAAPPRIPHSAFHSAFQAASPRIPQCIPTCGIAHPAAHPRLRHRSSRGASQLVAPRILRCARRIAPYRRHTHNHAAPVEAACSQPTQGPSHERWERGAPVAATAASSAKPIACRTSAASWRMPRAVGCVPSTAS